MTSIKNDRKVKEKNQESTPIRPEILELVSFDVNFEIPTKKEYEIEVEIGRIKKHEITKLNFGKNY